MKGPYDDIIALPHPTSRRHPRMPAADRAAQFAPFAALTGYAAAIKETARETEAFIEPAEDEAAALDRQLRLLEKRIQNRPWVVLTCFQPDQRKTGGAYVEVQGRVKRMDAAAATITLEDGREIPVSYILEIKEEDTYGEISENSRRLSLFFVGEGAE